MQIWSEHRGNTAILPFVAIIIGNVPCSLALISSHLCAALEVIDSTERLNLVLSFSHCCMDNMSSLQLHGWTSMDHLTATEYCVPCQVSACARMYMRLCCSASQPWTFQRVHTSAVSGSGVPRLYAPVGPAAITAPHTQDDDVADQ